MADPDPVSNGRTSLGKVGWNKHARRQVGHHRHIAGDQGQLEDLPAVDHLSHGAGGRVQQRRLGGDLDAFRGLADLHRHIDRDPVVDARLDPGTNPLLEARELPRSSE